MDLLLFYEGNLIECCLLKHLPDKCLPIDSFRYLGWFGFSDVVGIQSGAMIGLHQQLYIIKHSNWYGCALQQTVDNLKIFKKKTQTFNY